MKWLPVAALAVFSAAPAIAAPFTLDFEGPTSFAPVADYYNGGTNGAGVSGPSVGVSFGGDALALQNDAAGTYFSHAPSPLGVLAPVGPDSAMNVAAGFYQGISFYYSSAEAISNAVQVWSGADGLGSLLASFNLGANATTGGCTDSPYCNFNLLSASFSGVAHSMTFASGVAFDNISVNVVPEPATALLLALGLGGIALTRRRS